jgi:thioredoxin reductase
MISYEYMGFDTVVVGLADEEFSGAMYLCCVVESVLVVSESTAWRASSTTLK